jgi:hypothetical protein
MKYLKKFENLREEFPIEPRKPEDEPQLVPGFESGTIDPEDDASWNFYGVEYESGVEMYKKFLKIVKERNFKENKDEIIIDLRGIGYDYCMSIYQANKHMVDFLNNELKGKYISKGFKNIMTEKTSEGIIEEVILFYSSGDCSTIFNLKLKNEKYDKDYMCERFIIIDKIKSNANKYNL